MVSSATTRLGSLVIVLLATGCLGSVDVTPGVLQPTIELPNFSWVIDGKLAGMARPGTTRPLSEDLAELHRMGIRMMVSLTETPLPSDEIEAAGLRLLHIPVRDMTAPSQAQLAGFVEQASAALDGGTPVGVHCAAGQGRTGTFLAAYFIGRGMDATAAIEEIRRLRPGSIETDEQEQALYLYARGISMGVDDKGESGS